MTPIENLENIIDVIETDFYYEKALITSEIYVLTDGLKTLADKNRTEYLEKLKTSTTEMQNHVAVSTYMYNFKNILNITRKLGLSDTEIIKEPIKLKEELELMKII